MLHRAMAILQFDVPLKHAQAFLHCLTHRLPQERMQLRCRNQHRPVCVSPQCCDLFQQVIRRIDTALEPPIDPARAAAHPSIPRRKPNSITRATPFRVSATVALFNVMGARNPRTTHESCGTCFCRKKVMPRSQCFHRASERTGCDPAVLPARLRRIKSASRIVFDRSIRLKVPCVSRLVRENRLTINRL